jgi:hypothetical protein
LPNRNQINEDFSKFLEALSKALPVFSEGSTEIGAVQLQNKMRVRIHEVGVDANGEVLKQGRGYSEAYAKFRQGLGRQVAKIDLDLFGDLKRSPTVIKSTQGQNIIFNQSEQTDKARDIEKRFGQQIFIPSSVEAEDTLDLIEEQFNELIDELAARYSFKV